jgi:exodeoxyribonuclease V beta subunit
MGSFSSMTTGHDSALPDFDSQLGPGRADKPGGFFAFPRGARAGTCVHRVLELIDFGAADLTARRQTVGQVLGEHGFDDEWTSVVDQMLDKVLQSPLNDDGLHLGTLAHTDRVDEMAFCYPVDALDAKHWREVLVRNTTGLHPALRLGLDDWHFEPLAGFMHGFIDLVFQASGRYYLVDYKSNYLGSDLGAYSTTALNTTMHRSHYTLQYLIYTVALHRWLRTRIPDYSYEHHFGGAYYLFLRGMDPSRPGNGVFFDRPSANLIEDLDALIGGPS